MASLSRFLSRLKERKKETKKERKKERKKESVKRIRHQHCLNNGKTDFIHELKPF